jgi:hypothetical protein
MTRFLSSILNRVQLWICRHWHAGAINVTSTQYECRDCLRVYKHSLAEGFREWPKPQPVAEVKRSKVRSISRRKAGI